jgi:hypothetical protein
MLTTGHGGAGWAFWLLLVAAGCPAAAPPDRCIVGESAFGCRSEARVAAITSQRGDPDTLHETIVADVASGACEMFRTGEPVQLTGIAPSGDLASVRRPGEMESYWIPATWSRPASECAAYTTSRSQREKLGLAAISQADPPEEMPSRYPPAPSRSVVPGCTFKPVMTDADIALCRKLDR